MTTILTQTVARLLFLPILMVAIATLVKGYADTGDGFTAGVIAALAVLLQFLAFGEREVRRLLPIRLAPTAALVGLVIALVVTFLPLVWGDPLLTHAPAPGDEVVHLGALELLTAVVFDIGVFLLVFGFTVSTIGMVARIRRRRVP